MPKILDRPEMSIFHKSACEALWRRATERNDPHPDFYVNTQSPLARVRLADQVSIIPYDFLHRIVLPEIEEHGRLAGGFSMRWSAGYLRDTGYREPSPRAHALTEDPPRWDPRGTESTTSSTRPELSDDDATPKAEKADFITKDPTRPRLGRRSPAQEIVPASKPEAERTRNSPAT